jgi:hypothetical protein
MHERPLKCPGDFHEPEYLLHRHRRKTAAASIYEIGRVRGVTFAQTMHGEYARCVRRFYSSVSFAHDECIRRCEFARLRHLGSGIPAIRWRRDVTAGSISAIDGTGRATSQACSINPPENVGARSCISETRRCGGAPTPKRQRPPKATAAQDMSRLCPEVHSGVRISRLELLRGALRPRRQVRRVAPDRASPRASVSGPDQGVPASVWSQYVYPPSSPCE